MQTARQRGRRLLLFLAVPPVLFCTIANSGSAQRDLLHKNSGPVAAAFLPFPFRIGETLRYQVTWSSFPDAASLILRTLQSRSPFPASDWHFHAAARTLGSVRTLFPIDDLLDSDSAAQTLVSRELNLHLDEPGRKQDRALQLVSPDEASQIAPPHVIVPPGTRDPLGAFYALRAIDWQEISDWCVMVYDGNDVYFLRAHREVASELVTVPAGHFTATRILIRLFQYGREVPGQKFIVWLAQDSAHTPVQMEADMPMKTLRAQLAATGR